MKNSRKYFRNIEYASPEYWEETCGRKRFLGNTWGTRWKAYTKVRYKKYLELTKGKWSTGVNHVLDVGCSDGDFLYFLWKKNKVNKICGIDCAQNAVLEARRRFKKFYFKQCTLQEMYKHLPTEKFDLVFCTGTIHYVGQQYDLIFRGFYKILKDNGILLIEYPSDIDRSVEKQILRSIKDYFVIVRKEYEFGKWYREAFSEMWKESFQLNHPNFFRWIMTLLVLSNYPLAIFFEKTTEIKGRGKMGRSGRIYLLKKISKKELQLYK